MGLISYTHLLDIYIYIFLIDLFVTCTYFCLGVLIIFLMFIHMLFANNYSQMAVYSIIVLFSYIYKS